jgi:hypothetical protein
MDSTNTIGYSGELKFIEPIIEPIAESTLTMESKESKVERMGKIPAFLLPPLFYDAIYDVIKQEKNKKQQQIQKQEQEQESNYVAWVKARPVRLYAQKAQLKQWELINFDVTWMKMKVDDFRVMPLWIQELRSIHSFHSFPTQSSRLNSITEYRILLVEKGVAHPGEASKVLIKYSFESNKSKEIKEIKVNLHSHQRGDEQINSRSWYMNIKNTIELDQLLLCMLGYMKTLLFYCPQVTLKVAGNKDNWLELHFNSCDFWTQTSSLTILPCLEGRCNVKCQERHVWNQ